MNTRSFIITILLAAVTGVAGYYLGEKNGIKKGAFAGSGMAVMSLESQLGFMRLLEKSMYDGNPNEKMVRDLMIDSLETYQVARMTLAHEPFGHEYSESQYQAEKEAIDEATQRLRTSTAILTYEGQIQTQ